MNQDEDINAPTVPSGPTTNGHIDTSIPKTKQELLRLMDQRDDLEAELKALGEVLDSVCLADIGEGCELGLMP